MSESRTLFVRVSVCVCKKREIERREREQGK